MTPEEAEAKIVWLVRDVDAVRAMNISKAKTDGRIAELNQEIRELKKITGVRHITGKYGA